MIVYQRTGGKVDFDRAARQVAARAASTRQPTSCEPEWVGAEHPLFLLYTSGSTGKPKGVQHSHRRLPAARGADDEVDLRPASPTTCSGAPPTSAGSPATPTSPTGRWRSARTEVVFEGVPTYPDAGRFWKMIEKHKVTVFYTAPTAIRSLIKAAEGNAAVHPKQLRPVEPAHPRHGRRADQPGRLGVVPPARRRRPLPDRRHLLADRDRRPHDHAAAGRDAAGAGLVHAAVPRHHGGDRRRDRQRRAERPGRHPGHQEAVAER